MRHKGDYGGSGPVTREEAEEVIENAERFLDVAQQLIGPIPPE